MTATTPCTPCTPCTTRTLRTRRPPATSASRRIVALALLAATALGGCAGAGGGEGSTLEWGTKHRSVLPTDTPRLDQPQSPAAPARPRVRETTRTAAQMRGAAIEILHQAANASDPLLRAHSIEALHAAPSAAAPAVRRALADDNEGVRFVAAMTVGRLQLHSLAILVEPMLHDPSPSVQAAAIFALSRCGRKVNPTPLSAMLGGDDAAARGNAALVLGELGDPTAVGMLREAASRRSVRMSVPQARIIELQVAEALVKLGVTQELEVIRAALFAPAEQAELTVFACTLCGELNDRAYAPALADLALRTGPRQEPPAVRIAAAQAVARIEPDRAPTGVPLSYLGHDDPLVRAQAAAALGWCRDPAYLPRLAAMMADPDPYVQVAAAGAVVRSAALGGTAALVDTNVGSR